MIRCSIYASGNDSRIAHGVPRYIYLRDNSGGNRADASAEISANSQARRAVDGLFLIILTLLE